MGRNKSIVDGVANSNDVTVSPVWNTPIDQRKLAKTLLAITSRKADKTPITAPAGEESSDE